MPDQPYSPSEARRLVDAAVERLVGAYRQWVAQKPSGKDAVAFIFAPADLRADARETWGQDVAAAPGVLERALEEILHSLQRQQLRATGVIFETVPADDGAPRFEFEVIINAPARLPRLQAAA